MKKTYKNPAMEIIKIATQQMIAQSLGMGEGKVDPNDAGGRSDDFDWDD